MGRAEDVYARPVPRTWGVHSLRREGAAEARAHAERSKTPAPFRSPAHRRPPRLHHHLDSTHPTF